MTVHEGSTHVTAQRIAAVPSQQLVRRPGGSAREEKRASEPCILREAIE